MTASKDSPDARTARFRRLASVPLDTIGSRSRPLAGAWTSIREIGGQKEMLGLLVRRDLKARYKDSALGFLWSLIKPLTQLVIYYVVVGKFLGAARGIPDFAIYIFTGLTAYTLFSEIVASATASIIGNAGLIKKIYLPREIFPLASVGSASFNFLIQLSILIMATIIVGSNPLGWDLLYFFPSVMVLLVYATALGLLLSALNVYLRDVQYLVEVGMMVLMWASPIVYTWAMVRDILGNGILLNIYTGNPITLSVLGFQQAFWTAGEGMPFPDDLLLRLAVTFVVGLVLLFISQRVFSRLQGNFAQEL
ncbi:MULTISPECIES: ABC transporter permease [unclassified Cryobacterium]|uniref:ABC transporter permease n=1 Tax=unclassified Cryobacterium TaxID=2649013 RepID=UPI00106A2E04|nr:MULTISPECIES: ABC transporter permease [unclassified Cryobacterium]TFC33350.1 ABC transporter permease [Cryobacterium sp. TMT2-42-4]TFC37097.1 ABC transporter permease [Cryobacterium sp. TMT2-14]